MSDRNQIDAITETQANMFQVLADPTRLKLLKLLANQKEANALCVNALAYQLNVTQSAVSQHLRILKSIDLVKGDKKGYRVHYFVNPDVLDQYRQITSELFGPEALNKNIDTQ